MKNKLKVFSLGGLGEIGKNMTVLEYGGDILIIDCGVAFPQDDMLGVDLVIPDFTYLLKNKQKIRGLVLTHAHEDHVGSTPFFLREYNVPVYGTKLTLGLMENKLREHDLLDTAKLNCVASGGSFGVGCFTVEFIRTTHSIADSVAVAVTTPVGVVIHSGDFKVDYTPIHGESIDLQRFAELGKRGVLLFMCESTNVEEKGYTLSERNVGVIFDGIFNQSPGQRIMVATFSSNIHRIQQIVFCAEKHDRKILILGRSMVNAIKKASELGYLSIPEHLLIEINELRNYPDNKVVVITTGSQGEPMSALSRMSAAEHRQMGIKPGDKIIISASPIPGNEKTVSKVINDLMRLGAEVLYEGLMEVHVSGHAKQEELKLLHALVKPKYLLPIHGEYRHLKHHRDLAVSMGMDKNDIFLMEIGDVLELSEDEAYIKGTVPSGHVYVDGLGVGDVGSVVLRDRKHLAADGLLVVTVGVSAGDGGFTAVLGPELISRGFVFMKDADNFFEEAKNIVRLTLEDCGAKKMTDFGLIRNAIRDDLKEFIWHRARRNPMILSVIMEM